jgi:DNA modification methylase
MSSINFALTFSRFAFAISKNSAGMNTLYYGDNLEILKSIPSESVDLIYIDPPFFSNRNYEVIWGDEGEVRSFKDRWAGGMEHYIGWLKERVEEMYRVLKPTGSFYLHCDWHADAYIRVGILDKVFGSGNFRSDICWKRTVPKGNAKTLANNTDAIFWYSKHDKKFIYNPEFLPLEGGHYSRVDTDGRIWQDTALNAPSKGYKYEWNGVTKHWRCSIEKMQEYEESGLLYYTSNGTARFKRYLEDSKGRSLDNCWTDIPPVNSQAKERIGYPTQKPEALLERIIKASSNEGDVVLDAFVGGGTTVAVADRLNRKWIGIDQSVQAIKVSEARLDKQRGLFQAPFAVKLHKYDYDTLRYKDAFEFESWIVEQFGGETNAKQRGDMGLDGKKNGVPIQVKRSDGIGRNVVDNFKSAMGRFHGKTFDIKKQKVHGYIIAFSFGKGAYEEIARLKNEEGLIIELIKVEDIVPIATKPKLEFSFVDKGTNDKKQRVVEFTAKTQSNIEFYQWDFNYKEDDGFKADVMIDKEGVQTKSFETGEYNIACKVVDMEGMQSIEIIKLKINGVVKKV